MVPPFELHGPAHELRRECRLFEEALGAREKKTCFEFFPPFSPSLCFSTSASRRKGRGKKLCETLAFPLFSSAKCATGERERS